MYLYPIFSKDTRILECIFILYPSISKDTRKLENIWRRYILGPGTPESTLYLRSYCSFFILFHSLLVYSVSLFFSFIHSSVPLFIVFNPYSFHSFISLFFIFFNPYTHFKSFISSILYLFQSVLISFLHQFHSLSFLIRILISDPSSAPFFIFFNPY